MNKFWMEKRSTALMFMFDWMCLSQTTSPGGQVENLVKVVPSWRARWMQFVGKAGDMHVYAN